MLEEAEATIRELVDRRKDKSNLSHMHSLSSFLYDRGKYVEAEEMERKVKV